MEDQFGGAALTIGYETYLRIGFLDEEIAWVFRKNWDLPLTGGLPSRVPATGAFKGRARLEGEVLARPGEALQVALVFEFDPRLRA
jgi:hypothetical protein